MGTTLIEEPGRRPQPKGTTLVGAPGGGTRLVGSFGAAEPGSGAAMAVESERGPVVGWLVIVSGPGRGRSLELGLGMNIIGRGASNRINLDYGDDQISAEDHFRIAFDAQNHLFHLVPGRGTNLVYVGGQPLLSPVQLASGSELTVGATKLRFAAFCGPDWTWEA